MSNLFLVSYVLLWILVVVCLVGLFGLYHHFGQMYLVGPESRGRQGQPVGDMVRAVEALSLNDEPVLIPAQGPTLLLFVSTTCNTCKVIRDALPAVQTVHPELRIVIFCGGRSPMVRAWSQHVPAGVDVVADPRTKLASTYGVDLTPFAIGVGAEAMIRFSALVNTLDDLLEAADAATSAEPVANPSTHEHSHAS